MQQKKARGIALFPFLLFIIIYLGAGIILQSMGVDQAFYQFPAPTACLIGVVVAFLMFKGSIDEKFATFAKGVGSQDITIMCMIYLLSGAFATVSSAMGWAITTLQVAQTLAAFCMEFITSQFMFLLFMNILLLILGMVLDATPAILLMVPILWPVAQTYDIDAIRFGIIMCLNLMIGNLTPPVGMMLFVVSNVGKVKLSLMYRGILPFIGAAVIVLLLVTYVPAFSTFIPNLLMP